MNLEYLNTFIEVVKAGNLSKAAKKLYITQPTVTFQIKRLEEELGYRLIERNSRNFLLTTNGKRFFRFAEYVYQEHRHVLFDMAQNEKGITGRLSVAAPPIIAEYIVPNLISRYREDTPVIDIEVNIMDSRKAIQAVVENPEIVGFCGAISDFKKKMSEAPELTSSIIGEDEMVLIVYPGHPFTIKKQITIADVIGEPLILRAETAGRDLFYARILKKAGLDLDVYHPKIIMGTTSGVLSAVESKVGIGFVSNLAIKNSEAMGLVKVVKIKEVRLRNQYYIVHHKDVATDSPLADFVSFIHQAEVADDNH
jgi:DNA-binding transcriptional LysR family regulator